MAVVLAPPPRKTVVPRSFLVPLLSAPARKPPRLPYCGMPLSAVRPRCSWSRPVGPFLPARLVPPAGSSECPKPGHEATRAYSRARRIAQTAKGEKGDRSSFFQHTDDGSSLSLRVVFMRRVVVVVRVLYIVVVVCARLGPRNLDSDGEAPQPEGCVLQR